MQRHNKEIKIVSCFAKKDSSEKFADALGKLIREQLRAGNDPDDYERVAAVLSGSVTGLIELATAPDITQALAMANRFNVAVTEGVTQKLRGINQ
jgi:hypothetical protein